MNLLITGSRNASPAMLAEVSRVIHYEMQPGDRIIVGDAEGIDAEVIRLCDALGVGVYVFGAYDKLRNKTKTGKNLTVSGTYTQRDRIMAAIADKCCAIWDGKSVGTRATATYAEKRGKPVTILTPDLLQSDS